MPGIRVKVFGVRRGGRAARGRARVGGIAFVLLAQAIVGVASLLAVPAPASAYTPRAPILIDGNAEFTPANGVTGGTGTAADPYRIEGWEIDASLANGITITNTDAYALVRGVFVHSGGVNYDGILLDAVANVVVEAGMFVDNSYGIVAYASSAVAIANNQVANSFWEGILVESSSSAVVRGNDVQLSGVYGIDVFTSTDVEVRDNNASTGWETGIFVQNADRVFVTGNNASSNALMGISLDFASNVTINNNSLWDNAYGMDLFDSGPVLARQNTIGRSITEAVSIGYSNNVTIDMNRFVSNDGGLFAAFATDLVVAHNTFDGNTFQGGDDFGTRTAWDRGYPAGGNFWSDYTGIDLCSGPSQDVCTGPDGIGDTPYAVDVDTQDRYPLMQPYEPGSGLTTHAPIVIVGNAEFTGANGVTGGSGTPSDPYIIEGWEIDGSANSGIEVYNTDVHFVIRDVYVHSSLIDAIYFYSIQNGTVENATVSGNDGALYIEVSSNITINSSNISFNGLDAVVLDWSSNVTVEGNEMWGNGDWGVFAYESDDLVIRNNTIANNGWIGIELSLSSDRVIVEGNSVTNNNIAGLSLDTASNVTVRSNTFADNDYNVDLTNSNDVLIRNNTVATSTSDGITITGGARLTIEENNITGNGGGVLAVGATALRVYHNAFNGNLPQAADVNGANAWDDGYPSGGNFWSDYTGVDTCSGPNQDICPDPDGFGDTPYVIDADSQDRYPLIPPSPNTAPVVTVLAPSGGEDWTGGTAHGVMWTMDDAEDSTLTVVVDLSTDGGALFPYPLLSGLFPIGPGSYSWALPLVDTTTALIRVCVFDSGGLSACAMSGLFTIDSTRPLLIATQPPNGASNIDPRSDIVLTFIEPMNRTETEAAVGVAPAVTATASWDALSTVLTLRPTAPLANITMYAVTIGCGAEDDSDPGNALGGCPVSFSFTTWLLVTPPEVAVDSPSGGERWTGGTPHAITWTMSDTTTPGDLTANVAYSTDGGGTWTPMATGLVRPQGLNAYAWLAPSIDATGVTVRVCAWDGVLTACAASPAFAVDFTPPIVTDTIPRNGEKNVAVDQAIVITFSEAINAAAFPSSGFTMVPAVTSPVPAWFPAQTLTIAHDSLAPCTTYTATVDAAQDASDPGIPIPFAHSWSFSTVCPPTAEFLEPLGGVEWTGGSSHVVRFRLTDEADQQVWAWLNATVGGVPEPLYVGPVAVGETAFPWTVPAATAAATLRLEIADSSGFTASAMTPAFGVDATPPILRFTDPANGLWNVSVDSTLVLTFSERMNATATENAIGITPPAGVMSFSWDASFSVLTIRFDAPLAMNTSYSVAVGCTARDDSDPGNPLEGCPTATTEIGFRTMPEPPVASAMADVQARVGVPLTFDGRGSTGAIVRWAWTILDETGSVVAMLDGPVVTYTFSRAGAHTVTLQVTDAVGRTDEYIFDVIVQAVVGSDGGGGWFLVAAGAAAAAGILFTASEPGRVALMTATFARAYGRRRKDEKDSELRGAMLYYVRVHPGDCYMDIKRNLDLNDGVVTYHLAHLEKEGLIRSAIRGARKRYYPAEMRVPLENGGELHEIQQRILRFVGEAPGVPVGVLAEQLGVSNQLALYHLRKLSQGQRVELERAGLRLRAYPGRTEE